MPAPKKVQREQARIMFVDQGHSPGKIAEVLDVVESTVWSWAKKYKWREQRDNVIASDSVLRMAEEALRKVLEKMQGADQVTAKDVDSMTKLIKSIERLRGDIPLSHIAVMFGEKFLPFLTVSIKDASKRQVVVDAYNDFLEYAMR